MSLHRLFDLISLCTLTCFASGFGQNVHLSPAIPNETILDVEFVDSLHGYFSTAAGSIFMTEYGGWYWRPVVNFQGDPITQLRFLNPSIGFGASRFSGSFNKVTSVVTNSGGWQWGSNSLYLEDVYDFLPVSESILLASKFDGIYRLDNFYNVWERTFTVPRTVLEYYGYVSQLLRLTGDSVLALASYGAAKKAGVMPDSINLILRSTNGGATWDTLWQGLSQSMNTMAFASASVGWMGGENRTILRTTDKGRSWVVQYNDSLASQTIQSICCIDANLVLAVDGGGTCLKTTDGGASWSRVVIEQVSGLKTKIAFATQAKGFYAGSHLYRTDDGGTTWHFAHDGTIIDSAWQVDFVNLWTGWVLADSGLYVSSNGGGWWTRQYRFQSEGIPVGFDMIDSANGWAVNRYRQMKTRDGGNTWTSTDFDPAFSYVGGIKFYNKDFGAIFDVREQSATNQSSFLITTDGGVTWIKRQITLTNNPPPCRKVEFTDPGHLWFANKMGLWLSRDSARGWTLFDTLHPDNSAFDFLDSLAGYCDNGPDSYGRTTDGGRTWKLVRKPYSNQTFDIGIVSPSGGGDEIAVLAGAGGTLFAASSGDFIQSTDTYITSDLKSISVVRDGYTKAWWAVGSRFDVLNTVFYLTDVPSHQDARPLGFFLAQNYPNPFNPLTVIKYTVGGTGGEGRGETGAESRGPGASRTTLVVYDMLGRQVATLVDEVKRPGSHEVTFDASGLASGVYVYRLQAGAFVQARKMLLLR